MRSLTTLAALLWASLAMAGDGTLTQHSLTVNGVARTYWHYDPPGPNAPGLPLILAFHGGGGSGSFVQGKGLVALAAADGAILIAPDGLLGSWRHTDDPAAITRAAYRDAGDDLALVAALAATVLPTLGHDPARQYLTGFSAGGMMAYRVACQRPGGLAVAGLAAVSATMTVAPASCPGALGVPLLHMHGSADTNVPYLGGGSNTTATYPAVSVGFGHFRAANACGPQVEVLPRPAPDTQEWRGVCAGGVGVAFDWVNGGTHAWFTPPSLDATARLAAFFAL